MSVLVLVPARGGSKGVPRKNLRSVSGISLVGLATRSGRRFLRETGVAGAIIVDTDSKEIADEAAKWGAEAPFLRPPELAADTTPTIDNVLYAVERLAGMGRVYDTVVLLQPTSPLREASDIVACYEAYDSSVGSCVSITHSVHPPEQSLRMSAEGTVTWVFPDVDPSARRQSFSRSYRPSGAVYVSSVDSLKRHRAFVVSGVTRGVPLPESRAVDVDTVEDLAIAGALAAARSIADVDVAGRRIGPSAPVFFIAEARIDHDGDVELAHRLIDVAANAGADAVTLRPFDSKRLAEPAFPREAYRELSDHAQERAILFLFSPVDQASADFLDEIGVPAFQVGSSELTNHSLLSHLATKRKPLLVSTGAADMTDIDGALDAIRDGGNPPVCLLYCATGHPASAGAANLRAIGTMKAAFGIPVGFSDHTEGIHVSLAAVAMGASVIEKRFALDRSQPSPEHRASLLPDELAALVRQIRPVEESLGGGSRPG